MKKTLHQLTKKELISIIQDYQEMVSEIEGTLNTLLSFQLPIHVDTGLLEMRQILEHKGLLEIRDAIGRHVHKEEPENVGKNKRKKRRCA